MYLVAAENNNHITENPGWADSPSIMGESGIVMEVSTGSILYEKICMIFIIQPVSQKL